MNFIARLRLAALNKALSIRMQRIDLARRGQNEQHLRRMQTGAEDMALRIADLQQKLA